MAKLDMVKCTVVVHKSFFISSERVDTEGKFSKALTTRKPRDNYSNNFLWCGIIAQNFARRDLVKRA